MIRLSPTVVAIPTGVNGSAIFIRQSCYPDPTDPQCIDLYVGNLNEVRLDFFGGVTAVRPCLTKAEILDFAQTLTTIAENDMWISTARLESTGDPK